MSIAKVWDLVENAMPVIAHGRRANAAVHESALASAAAGHDAEVEESALTIDADDRRQQAKGERRSRRRESEATSAAATATTTAGASKTSWDASSTAAASTTKPKKAQRPKSTASVMAKNKGATSHVIDNSAQGTAGGIPEVAAENMIQSDTANDGNDDGGDYEEEDDENATQRSQDDIARSIAADKAAAANVKQVKSKVMRELGRSLLDMAVGESDEALYTGRNDTDEYGDDAYGSSNLGSDQGGSTGRHRHHPRQHQLHHLDNASGQLQFGGEFGLLFSCLTHVSKLREDDWNKPWDWDIVFTEVRSRHEQQQQQ
ncbi:hypothetical protein RI367_007225 [Sorochytrium milnesiophthora]